MNVKKVKILLIVLIIPLLSKGQTDYKYFKINWKPTSEKQAYYIRNIQKISNELYHITDSSIEGEVKRKGFYKSIEPEIEHGNFEYFFKKQNKIFKGNYENGKLFGLWNIYDTIGTLLETIDYSYTLTNIEISNLPKESMNDNFYFEVETKPQYKNGIEDFIKYIRENLIYPPNARIQRIQGIVKLQFMIDTTGKIVNINVIESISKDLDMEAIRVINKCEPWSPALQSGIPVIVKFMVPIEFTIND